jgi:hypothetical protein
VDGRWALFLLLPRVLLIAGRRTLRWLGPLFVVHPLLALCRLFTARFRNVVHLHLASNHRWFTFSRTGWTAASSSFECSGGALFSSSLGPRLRFRHHEHQELVRMFACTPQQDRLHAAEKGFNMTHDEADQGGSDAFKENEEVGYNLHMRVGDRLGLGLAHTEE